MIPGELSFWGRLELFNWETAHAIPDQPRFIPDWTPQWQAAEKTVCSRTLTAALLEIEAHRKLSYTWIVGELRRRALRLEDDAREARRPAREAPISRSRLVASGVPTGVVASSMVSVGVAHDSACERASRRPHASGTADRDEDFGGHLNGAIYGSGWLAALAWRIVHDASQQKRDALGITTSGE